jgi:hypothetical protein
MPLRPEGKGVDLEAVKALAVFHHQELQVSSAGHPSMRLHSEQSETVTNTSLSC